MSNGDMGGLIVVRSFLYPRMLGLALVARMLGLALVARMFGFGLWFAALRVWLGYFLISLAQALEVTVRRLVWRKRD